MEGSRSIEVSKDLGKSIVWKLVYCQMESKVRGPQCWEKGTSLQPNTIFAIHTSSVAKEVESDHKHKSSLPAKQQHKKSRQTYADDSLSSWSYSHYNGGPNVADVIHSPQHLQDRMITFYRTKSPRLAQAKQLQFPIHQMETTIWVTCNMYKHRLWFGHICGWLQLRWYCQWSSR